MSISMWVILGSSPLTRGAPNSVFSHRGRLGLIPAHAGSTRGLPTGWPTFGAHPRSRGEHCGKVGLHCGGGGSSPLTRGALSVSPQHCAPHRLIPAHAGSTTTGLQAAKSARAHPRSRGEHVWRE